MTTLGWLKHLQDPAFGYYEWQHLKVIHRFLTDRWWILQAKVDDEALQEWLLVMKVLELDLKARQDLFLLLQSGMVGRSHANHVLWKMLTGPAIDPVYPDLSAFCTNLVYRARRNFDRPPRAHEDLDWWWWTCYEYLYRYDQRWSPQEVPGGRWALTMGHMGKPLQPPECWGLGGPAR